VRYSFLAFRKEAILQTRRAVASLLLAAVLPISLALPANSQNADQIAKTTLKVGDHAPDFSLLSDKWEPVKLSDFRGKKNVFLAVYVLAFTGG
jgi:cytochrome oxidase Cu insertion factor (SCO1/SenC/PrrC family)